MRTAYAMKSFNFLKVNIFEDFLIVNALYVKYVKGPLHLAKFAIANIGQVLVQVFVQVLTQYLVQVVHFSGIFIS